MTSIKRIISLTLSCFSLAVLSPTLAHEADKANPGFVGDTTRHQVTDSSGKCVKSGDWAKDMTECGPAPVEAVAPEPEPVATPEPAPAPKPVVVRETVALTAGTLFDLDKDTLKPDGVRELTALASRLKALKEIHSIQIVGHTDSSGSDSYNQLLSQRRAISVKNFLADQGIPHDTMSTVGMGESSPVASNATKDGRAQNRRVELSIQGFK